MSKQYRTAAIVRFTLALVLTWAGSAPAEAPAVGTPAPAFELAGSDGRTHRLADYRGTAVVLAWFPKAFTGG